MRVQWSEFSDMPEEYWERVSKNEPHLDPKFLRQDYVGEVISTVRSWGVTTFVVMLDSGTIREIAASKVKKA